MNQFIEKTINEIQCLIADTVMAEQEGSRRCITTEDLNELEKWVQWLEKAGEGSTADPSGLYTSAIREWGKEAQMLMAIEECSELIQALTKVWRGKHSKNNIEEEIADVEIMIGQLKIIFDADKVADWRMTKLERLHKLLHGT